MEWLEFNSWTLNLVPLLRPERVKEFRKKAKTHTSEEMALLLRRYLDAEPSARPSHEETLAALAKWESARQQ